MNEKCRIFAFFLVLLLVTAGTMSCGCKDKKGGGVYKNPESFIVDPETGSYFISNVNGSPSKKDGNGFIVKLDRDLDVIDGAFISSGGGVDLNAPKGMAIVGDTLYVTDITSVRGYDKETGRNVADIDLSGRGARFLNDMVADKDGSLYVSAMHTNTIYKIDTGNDNDVSVHKRGSKLDSPNGLVIEPDMGDLIVATWGGKILRIDKDGKITTYVSGEYKGLDGIDYDKEGNLYVSSFTEGKIYRITPEKKVTTIKKGLKTPADISVDRKNNLLLVPLMDAGKIITIDLGEE